MSKTTPEIIGSVLSGIMARSDAKLFAATEAELEQWWYFKWDDSRGIEWNTYRFSDSLESFKQNCRRWEEKHNGSSCVVDRVRDKYVMPKVRAFLGDIAKHLAENQPSQAEGISLPGPQ